MAKVRLRATAPKKHPEYGNIVEYYLDIYYGKKHKPKRQKKKVLDKWAYSSPYTTPQKQFNRSVLRQCEAYRDRVKVQIDDGNNPFLKKVSDEKNNRTLLEQLYSVQRHRGANSSKTLQMYEATQRHLINFLKEVNFKQSFYNAEKKAKDICIKDIDSEFAKEFKLFLQSTPTLNYNPDKPTTRKNLSPTSIRTYWIRFAVVINDAVTDGVINEHPFRNVEPPIFKAIDLDCDDDYQPQID